MTETLSGRVIAVTGAGRGIGHAISMELARRGATVIGLDRDIEQAAVFPDSAGSMLIACDVSDESSVSGAFDTISTRFYTIDGLVNNAGIMLEKTLADTTPAEFDRVIGVNLRGVFLCTKSALRFFRKGLPDADKPRIVNIASELAHLGRAEYSAYCASKGGVIGLTRSWARELAPDILVNALAPGPTDTDMLRAEKNYTAWVETAEGIPLGRAGTAEDIALGVAFLCGPDSRFMTGSIVDVNGGAAMY